MSLFLGISPLLIAGFVSYRALDAKRLQLVEVVNPGFLSVELRRCAVNKRYDGDSQAFPLPRERRSRVWRLGGIPVWQKSMEVSLPSEVADLVHQVQPQDFDRLFSAEFQVAHPRKSA